MEFGFSLRVMHEANKVVHILLAHAFAMCIACRGSTHLLVSVGM